MVFGILTRSDVPLLRACFSDDIYAMAKQLSDGHVFSVEVWAIFHDNVTCNKLLKELEPAHVANGWYSVTLTELTQFLANAVANATDQTGEGDEENTGEDDGADAEADVPSVNNFPGSLMACDVKFAPSATKLKAELQDRLGKEGAKLVLSQLKQKVRRNADGTVGRMLTFKDIPMTLGN
jgi:hypothetical protein